MRASTLLFMATRRPIPAGPSITGWLRRLDVLRMYRSVVRKTKHLDPVQCKEVRAFAYEEIMKMKDVKDEQHIRMLISEGNRQVDTLDNMISFAYQYK